MFSSPLISTCKVHKPRGNTRHTMQHTRLYISGQICSVFFSSTLLYVCWSFCLKKNLKTVRHLSFAFIIVFIFDRFFFVCQRRFLQCLQWVLMGFSVCSTRFLVGSDGFLLWLSRKRNTSTFMKNTAIEQVIKLFLCVQTWL